MITWRELEVWTCEDNEYCGTLGDLTDNGMLSAHPEVRDGKIEGWLDYLIAAPREAPDWDTPRQPVDWDGFEEAFKKSCTSEVH